MAECGVCINRSRAALITIIIGLCAAWASAQVKLKVDVAWNNFYRAGKWVPIYVSATDVRPRNVIIDVHVPHDPIQSMRIYQRAAIGPTQVTFVLYAPMMLQNEGFTVTLRDANTRKTLASAAPMDWQTNSTPLQLTTIPQLIGISARSGRNAILEAQLSGRNTAATSMPDPRLPAVAMGYDALNLLVLDQPDFTRISLEQQNAMLDWARAGGSIICWMSADPLAPNSPIIEALPVGIGNNTTYTLSADALTAAGLTQRFANLKGREVAPKPDAMPIELFGGEVNAYRADYGFGNITLLPIDASSFIFMTESQTRAFWAPLLAPAVDLPVVADPNQMTSYSPYQDAAAQTFTSAASQAMNLLADVPGAGNIGFWYVAILLIGMMLVVGPLDWFVLKRLDRQPWTWVTTTGWIALITLGAIYTGHIFKSGELHYRTLRLVDQAAGQTVAATDALSIYSPKTTTYDVDYDRESWWEPLSAQLYARSTGMVNDITFHQDQHGTRADSMRVSIWSLRLLIGRTMAAGPPVIDAKLHIQSREDGDPRLVGSITNLSDVPFTRMRATLQQGMCEIPTAVAPGATVEIDARIAPDPQINQPDPAMYAYPGSTHARVQNWLFLLAPERALRIEQMLRSPQGTNLVCVMAEAENVPTPPATLPDPSAKQQHLRLFRAMLKLEDAPQ